MYFLLIIDFIMLTIKYRIFIYNTVIFDLSGNKYVVTGATGGIGRYIVKALVDLNAVVLASGSNEQKLNELQSDFGVRTICCDLCYDDQRESLIRDASEMMNGFDGLVANAGIKCDKLALHMTNEEWSDVVSMNLNATFFLNRDALSVLMKQKYGRVVNISSIIANTGNIGQSSYAASKAGINAMSKCLAQESARFGVTVNCVVPGFIDVGMTEDLSKEYCEGILSKIPMKKFGTGDDVAAAVAFLLSDAAKYITGEMLHVNGGLWMG